MRWTKNEAVIWEEYEGGVLLVEPRSGSRWALSAAAALAWKLCDGTRPLRDIADQLQLCSDSVERFCHQFEQVGLLLRTAGPRPALSTSHCSFRFGERMVVRAMGAGAGARRRPSPRGNSGPG